MIVTKSTKETQKLGEEIANKVKKGGILTLHGNLGSGKTTFVQGLAKGLGIKGKIISPTFIIVRKYVIPDPDRESMDSRFRGNDKQPRTKSQKLRAKNFYHIDLYRVESESDIKGLGLEEILNDPSNIVAIEWPEKIEKILPKHAVKIYFEYIEDNKRKIEIMEN